MLKKGPCQVCIGLLKIFGTIIADLSGLTIHIVVLIIISNRYY